MKKFRISNFEFRNFLLAILLIFFIAHGGFNFGGVRVWAGTIPPDPATLSFGAVTRSAIEVLWSAPGDDGASGQAASYDLRYSALGAIDTLAKFNAATMATGLPSPKSAGSSESFSVKNLSADTSYYFCLRTADEVPNLSPLSNSPLMKTLALSPPEEVGGLKGTRNESAGSFTLAWAAIARYKDGSPVDSDFSNYKLLRSTAASGGFSTLLTLSTQTLSATDTAGFGTRFYYKITAGDIHGNSSDAFTAIDNGPSTKLIFQSSDGGARLEIPKAIQGLLFKDENGLGSDVRISLTRRGSEEGGAIFLAYDLTASKISDGSSVNISFSAPEALLVFAKPAGVSADELSLFRYNGVDYTKLGGVVSANPGVQIGIAYLGRYRLQKSLRANTFKLLQTEPRKVFTPNGDGLYDTVTIHFENPANEVISGEIFDITGSLIATLKPGPTSTSLSWDGLENSGNLARPGVYIYQLRGGDKSLTGTVILTR